MKKLLFLYLGLALASHLVTIHAQAVKKDELKSGNFFYAGNLQPLQASK